MWLTQTQFNRFFWKAPRKKIVVFCPFIPLNSRRDGDHSLPPSTNMKRRAQALIIFVGYALKPRASPSSEESINTVMAQLTTLATLRAGNPTDAKVDEISEAARSSLHRLLSDMSVTNFIDSVESMLNSKDAKVG